MMAFFAAAFALLSVYYLPALGVYLIVGIVYAILKWVFKLLKLRRLVGEITADEVKSVRSSVYDTDAKALEHLRSRMTNKVFREFAYPPQVKNNKGWLMFWALAWPINLPWTLFHDVAKEAFSWVWHHLGGALQRIANSILPK